MTFKRYLESDALNGAAKITGLSKVAPYIVRLDETLFHPQGGGQRGDRGIIGNAKVLDTKHAEGGEVDHLVDRVEQLQIGQNVKIAVDPNFRKKSASLHTAGHAIADAVTALWPHLSPLSGHHWEGQARVEFEGLIDDTTNCRKKLQTFLHEMVATGLPIDQVGHPHEDRKIKIAGFEPVGCGGTHLSSMSSIAEVTIRKMKRAGQKTRVSYDVRLADDFS